MKNDLYIDLLLIFCAILGAILSIYLTMNPQLLELYTHKQTKKYLGLIINKQNDVRGKEQSQLAWQTLLLGDRLYENQVVFTGNQSHATLKLKAGGQIQLDENSLIQINSQNKSIELQLLSGSLEGSLGRSASVQLGNGKTLSGKGKFRLKKQASKISLDVKSGELNVGSTKVSSKERIILDKDTLIKEKAIEILNPINNSTIWSPPQSQNLGVYLKWASLPGVSFYKVDVYVQNGDSRQLIKTISTPKAQAEFKTSKISLGKNLDSRPLKDPDQSNIQQFSWNIVGFNSKKMRIASANSVFYKRTLLSPLLISPLSGSILKTPQLISQKSNQVVPLIFQNKNNTKHIIQLSVSENNFKKPILNATTSEGTYSVSLSPGVYYWRVKRLNEKSIPESPWSTPSQFTILTQETLLPPEFVRIEKVKDLKSFKKTEIKLSWENKNINSITEILISANKNFEKDVQVFKIKENIFSKSFKNQNKYYLKMRSVNPQGEVSPFTKITPIDLYADPQKSAPEIPKDMEELEIEVRNKSDEVVDPFKQKDLLSTLMFSPFKWAQYIWEIFNPVANASEFLTQKKLSWGKVDGVKSYYIEISKDPQFSNIIFKSNTTTPSQMFEIPGYGTYYWHVRAQFTKEDYSPVDLHFSF